MQRACGRRTAPGSRSPRLHRQVERHYGAAIIPVADILLLRCDLYCALTNDPDQAQDLFVHTADRRSRGVSSGGVSDALAGSTRVLPVGYDLDHSGWAVEEAAAVGDTREGTVKIIYEDVGGFELPAALPFAASIEGAAFWRPPHSTESISARSESWRISRTCSSPLPQRLDRRPTAGRALREGREKPGRQRVAQSAPTLTGDSTAGRRALNGAPALQDGGFRPLLPR